MLPLNAFAMKRIVTNATAFCWQQAVAAVDCTLCMLAAHKARHNSGSLSDCEICAPQLIPISCINNRLSAFKNLHR